MPAVTLKGIPETLLRQLRRRAKSERRSLNAEILLRLERSLQGEPVDPAAFIRERDARMKRWGYKGPSSGEIEAAIRDGLR